MSKKISPSDPAEKPESDAAKAAVDAKTATARSEQRKAAAVHRH